MLDQTSYPHAQPQPPTTPSVELDEWTPEQLKIMRLSGNGNAASFFRSNGVRDLHIKTEQKYTTAAARQYKAHLKKVR